MTSTTTPSAGTFTFKDWQETVVAGDEGGARLARATVVNALSGAIEATATTCLYAISYAADGTGSFSGFQRCEGAVDGRAGTFTLREWGTFGERGRVNCSFEVVAGSGTGELTGLRGTGDYVAEPGQSAISYSFDRSLD
ncbi:DUF3224 domain-containing protein [Streptomyces hainanensis]|uniref:DUF3224 domain-containing protein n=1 Tax=Streptomyces hainanensis TaxID=402648 RepID=A0A4R4TIK1_9ACTN|nr:DUF3224 domain-containing protein [Streptomyces hainanensis]TDC74119.1 DUF3224 domain-containing protein [Streptomyces hainanensis]